MRRAKRLQRKLGIEHIYDSYSAMLDQEKLDAVYIATSHNSENAKLCLHRHLPVLIESLLMPLDETLETMRTMDALRVQWAMKYPGE